MPHNSIKSVTVFAILGIVFVFSLVSAQNPAATATPRTADGHPNFNGFWQNAQLGGTVSNNADGSVVFNLTRRRGKLCAEDDCQQSHQPVYKAQYAAKVKEIGATQSRGTSLLDPQFVCKPLGLPRAGTTTMQIVQSPETLAILYEDGPGPIWRLIYTDGRSHPKDFDSSFFGHSIGHWEGNTLVVDVIGLNDETWLGGGLPGDQKYTTIHSDKEHVIERWAREGDTITYAATVEDPVMFEKPWIITPRQIKLAAPGDEIFETPCVSDENIRKGK